MKRKYTLFLSILVLLTFLFSKGCKTEESNPVVPDTPKEVFEESGTVGANGAIVQVTNQSSPIKGAYVDIPEGALSANVMISISQAPSNIKAPTDTAALIIQFEPMGLHFNSEVKIALPYNSTNHDPNKLKAFYYDPDSAIVRELPIESIDYDKKVVVAYTDHFSKFYSGSSDVGADIEMVKINGKFAAKIRIFGEYPGDLTNTIYGIPLLGVISYIYSNIGYYLQENRDSEELVGIHVSLEEVISTIGPTVKPVSECNLNIHKQWAGIFGGINAIIEKFDYNSGESISLYGMDRIGNAQEIDLWFNGKTLIFRFDDFEPNLNKQYKLGVGFALSKNPNIYLPFGIGRLTYLYCVGNFKERRKISEVNEFVYDQDNNYVDDRYQPVNQPPNEPSNPNPSNNAPNQSINVDLSWQCSDPESDPLTYDIYFRTSANPPLVKNNHTSTSYDPGTLDYSKEYNWKIVAKDNHGNSTPGPIWKFTTAAQTVNQPPNTPSNPTPSWNATNQSINVDLSWDCSDPENDPLTYDIYFGTSSNPPPVKSNHTSTSYDPGVLQYSITYNWKIVAKDNQGNTKNGPIWNFTTIASGSTGQPCPGLPTITDSRDGKVYNTVQIESQCWLKENLDVGTMIQVNQNASNNGVIEKYCYDNDPSNCNIYGGLYLWDEVMQYSTNEGAQGICPNGWHLPTKAEFEALITLANNSSDGLLEVGQRTGATNSTGFSALLAGHRRDNAVFFPPYYAHFWSSSKFDGANSYYLLIDYPNDGSVSATSYLPNAFGLQIRCVKN